LETDFIFLEREALLQTHPLWGTIHKVVVAIGEMPSAIRKVADSQTDALIDYFSLIGDLATRISEQPVPGGFNDEHSFLPHGELDTVMTRELVIKKLTLEADVQQSSVDDALDFIFRIGAKALFATTVLGGFFGDDLLLAMLQFRDAGFSDQSLPILAESDFRPSFFGNQTSRPEKPWNTYTVHAFGTNQWKFLSPVLSSDNFELNLHPQHVLPFVQMEEMAAGAFGSTYRGTIHASNYRAPSHHVSCILVLKCLRSFANSVNIRLEELTLMLLSGNPDPRFRRE